MKWLKENIILLIFVVLALGFATSDWKLSLGVAVVGILFTFSFWGEKVTSYAKKGVLVFVLASVLVFAVRYSLSAYAENSRRAEVDSDLKSFEPNSVRVPTEAEIFDALSRMSKQTKEAYKQKIASYERLQSFYLAKGELDSARFCADSVLAIGKRGVADQASLETYLRERNGFSNIKLVSEEKSETAFDLGKTVHYFVEAGVPTRTGLYMRPGEGFEFFANQPLLVFDNQKEFGRYAKKEVNPSGSNKYWEQTDETEEMILEGLPGSNPMVVEIKRMK